MRPPADIDPRRKSTAPILAGDPDPQAMAAMKPRARAIPPGGAPDEEVAALMEELSRMQHWAVMLTARQDPTPGAREAMDLIQRTRCLIVERLYPANLGKTINE